MTPVPLAPYVQRGLLYPQIDAVHLAKQTFQAIRLPIHGARGDRLDAVKLARGDRADAGVIRAGAAKADISADFDAASLADVRAWLAAQELDDGDGACIVRRTIDSGGRSRAFVNGRPAVWEGRFTGELAGRALRHGR